MGAHIQLEERVDGAGGPYRTSGNLLLDQVLGAALHPSGLDQCGLTQLAGRTVGAPFVGAMAAAIMIGEALRVVNVAHRYDLIDGHLQDLKQMTVVDAVDVAPVNPGSTGVCAQ